MIHKHYRVTLSRDVLMTCPGGSGVVQTDTVEAVLLVPEVPRNLSTTFEGKMDGFCFPGPWKIVKMDVEIHDPSEDRKGPCKDCEEDEHLRPCAVCGEGVAFQQMSVPGKIPMGWSYKDAPTIRELKVVQAVVDAACALADELDKPGAPDQGDRSGDLYRAVKKYRQLADPPDESDGGFPYQDVELEEFDGVKLPKGRYVLRRTPDDNRLWDRRERRWVARDAEIGTWIKAEWTGEADYQEKKP